MEPMTKNSEIGDERDVRVLLFGGAGYIGTRLHAELLRRKIPVRCDDFQESLLPDTVQYDDTNVVIFLAWPRKFDIDHSSNRARSSVIAELMDSAHYLLKDHDHFIFLSSIQAGRNHPYGMSKFDFETFLAEQKQQKKVSIIRLASVNGFSPRMRWELILNRMTLDALTLGEVHVQGPELMRAHVNIERVVDKLIDLAHEKIGGREHMGNYGILADIAAPIGLTGKCISHHTNAKLEISNTVPPNTVSVGYGPAEDMEKLPQYLRRLISTLYPLIGRKPPWQTQLSSSQAASRQPTSKKTSP
jgi:hypothetical protein